MKSFEEIDGVYDVASEAAQWGWHVYRVAWPELKAYQAALRTFETSLAVHGLADDWAPFLAYARRYLFMLSTSPISPARLLSAVQNWKTGPRPNLGHLRAAAPLEVGTLFDDLDQAFRTLHGINTSPLWKTALVETVDLHPGPARASIAVLYSESRLLGCLEELFGLTHEPQLRFRPLRAAELKNASVYDRLITFGPPRRRFNDGTDFVFRCPRARFQALFTPDFFRADIPSPYELAGSPHLAAQLGARELERVSQPTVVDSRPSVGADLPAPSVEARDDDWTSVLPLPRIDYRPFADADNASWDRSDAVAATQMFLSADHIVYLPEDGSVYRVVEGADPETGKRICRSVEHIGVEEVTSGEILLFSEEGGGRMIQNVADEILRGEAPMLREIQADWKAAYTEMVRRTSESRALHSLRDLGAKSVTFGMIRNWRSPFNIGPGSWGNFAALLQYCGLQERRDEIFAATRKLRSAHIQAGAQLAGRLREAMQGQSLETLHVEGLQTFGGTTKVPTRKKAFFVVGLAPETVEVSLHDLAQPVEIKSWH